VTEERSTDSEEALGRGAQAEPARALRGVTRALVVEDEPSIRRTIVRTLESLGVETRHASTLKQASAMLVPPIDLVIADVRLPDGTGHAVITAALRFSPVPVLIAISGVASATEAFDLARAGAVAFLVKPFGLLELEQCLHAACDARAALTSGHWAALSPAAEQALQDLARRYRFTPRQIEVIRRTAEGTRRAELPKALGISEASCKTLVRRVLSRSGTARLADLTFAVLAAQQVVKPRAAPRLPKQPAAPRDEDASPPPRRGPRAGEL